MVLNTIDMNMQSLADKRLTACLLLIILELFFDGKFKIRNIPIRSDELDKIIGFFPIFNRKLKFNQKPPLIEIFSTKNKNRLGAESAASQQEVDRHLELGKQFLVNGQLSDALTHYHAAVGEYFEHL